MRLPEFVVGRPQLLAGLLLLAFAAQAFWLVNKRPFTTSEEDHIWAGRVQLRGSVPVHDAYSPLPNLAGSVAFGYYTASDPKAAITPQHVRAIVRRLQWMARLPFVLAGLLLGASVWYVARRLYGNAGGYIALALYCFSPALLSAAARVDPAVPAAWGIFGIIFVGIAIAHNLFAPLRYWRFRTALLALSMTIAVASHPAAMLAIPLAFAFMYYLVPGRRWAVALVIIAACLATVVLVFAAYSFDPHFARNGIDLRGWLRYQPSLSQRLYFEAQPFLDRTGPAVLTLFAWSLIELARSARSRYFGNAAPLIVFACITYVALTTAAVTSAALWSLPFLFVFIGGMGADLIEGRFRRITLALVTFLVLENAGVCLYLLAKAH